MPLCHGREIYENQLETQNHEYCAIVVILLQHEGRNLYKMKTLVVGRIDTGSLVMKGCSNADYVRERCKTNADILFEGPRKP